MAGRRICGPAQSLRNENHEEINSRDQNESGNPQRLELSSQISWMNLRKTLGLDDLDIHVPRNLIPFSIADVLNGNSDLRVSRMVALVLSVVHTSSGIWSLTLTDHSPATIDAFVTPKAIELYPPLLIPGTSFLAENVAIFVSSPSCQRILNLHERCIAAIFPSQNNLPMSSSESDFRSQDYFQAEEEEE